MAVTIKPSDVYFRVTKQQIADYLKETKQKITGFRLVKPKDRVLSVLKLPYVLPTKHGLTNIVADENHSVGYFRYILEPVVPVDEAVPGWE